MEAFLQVWIRIFENIITRYTFIAGTAYIVFYVLLKNQFLSRKIQLKFPGWDKMKMDILYSLQTIIIFAGIATIVLWGVVEHTNIYSHINDRGIFYYVISIPLMFLIHDTYFYWMHRFMHHPFIFKYIHLIHHKSTNPTPWTSYSFHFMESILEAAIIPIIAFTLPVHKSALIIFLLLQFIYNVYGHLGFELYPKNFNKHFIGRWINTSVAHNMHHKYFTGNYGLYFLFWDRLMGTLNPNYDDSFEYTTKDKTIQRESQQLADVS